MANCCRGHVSRRECYGYSSLAALGAPPAPAHQPDCRSLPARLARHCADSTASHCDPASTVPPRTSILARCCRLADGGHRPSLTETRPSGATSQALPRPRGECLSPSPICALRHGGDENEHARPCQLALVHSRHTVHSRHMLIPWLGADGTSIRKHHHDLKTTRKHHYDPQNNQEASL